MKVDITILYKDYYPKLLYYAGKFLPYDNQRAEEIVDDVFMKAREDMPRIKNELALNTWLYLATKNACFNELDHIKTVRKTILPPSSHSILDHCVIANTYAIQCEIVNEIYKEIERLPPQPRAVFELSYFEDKTLDEIASITGKTKQNIKNQLTFALKRLRVKFNIRSMVKNGSSSHMYTDYNYSK